MVSIIILTLNNWVLTQACLESIELYTDIPYELICIDNGSTDGTREHLRNRKNIRFIENSQNLGFAASCNQGIAVSSGEYILLLNNDTVVSHRWLGNLLRVLESSPKIAIVGPMSNLVLPQQHHPASYLNMEEYHRFCGGFNMVNPSLWRETTSISGFCMLFRRSLYEQIGGLDEVYALGGYEDIDFSYRTLKSGRRLFIAGDTFVHHEGNASFKTNSIDMQEVGLRNRRIFLRKWGFNPERLIFTLDANFLPGNYAAAHPHHPPAHPTVPSGILAGDSQGHVYRIEQGKKRPINSLTSFHAFKFRTEQIILFPNEVLEFLPEGIPLSCDGPYPQCFPSVFLAQDPSGGVYLISHGIRYPVADQHTRELLGYQADEAIPLSFETLALFPFGTPVDPHFLENHELIDYRIYMDDSSRQYYAEGGRLRPIPSQNELHKYKWNTHRPIRLPDALFSLYPIGHEIV